MAEAQMAPSAIHTPRRDHPYSVASLVLGIVGLVCLPIAAPIAVALARRGAEATRQAPEEFRENGFLTAGLVLGIVGTALLGLVVLAGLGLLLVVLGTSGAIPKSDTSLVLFLVAIFGALMIIGVALGSDGHQRS